MLFRAEIMSLIQLKPKEQAFYDMARNLTRKFRVIVLCEGEKDAEILKVIIAKIGMPLSGNIGITDCGGDPSIRDVAVYAATLAKLSRRLQTIVVMVDANRHASAARAKSVIDSLNALGIDIMETQEVEESLYKAKTERLDILVQIVGIKELPFKKHTIEDHVIQLLILEGKIKKEQIEKTVEAKEILDEQKEKIRSIIENSKKENVEQAFKNIIELLRVLR